MRQVVMYKQGDVRVEQRPDPAIVEPTDAIIRLAATCVCGSDLWPYRTTPTVSECAQRTTAGDPMRKNPTTAETSQWRILLSPPDAPPAIAPPKR